jgi:hypothetical protein
MAESLFGLSGDDYWRDPWKGSAEMHQKFVLGGKYGLYIDAPASVNAAVHFSVPVPMFYVAEFREAYKIDLRSMTKLVAIRLEDRSFLIENALPPLDKVVEEVKMGKDSSDPTSSKQVIDLQTQLRILDRPGKYRIVLLLQQQTSNVVETVVEQKKVQHPDPEAQKFIESFKLPEIPPPPPPPPSPELRWVRKPEAPLQPLEGSPPIPEKPGIEMKVDRVVLSKPGASGLLKGSFRLPVLKRDLLPERPPDMDLRVPFTPEYGMPRPTAMVPITLVILASESSVETVIRLSVPTFDPFDPAAKENFGTGYFAVDLLAHPNLRGAARIFSTYAFCGEFMKGPVVMATVTPEMLPIPIV